MKQQRSFGQYVLSFHPLELREGERVLDLTPRQLGVLTLLVEAQGKIVTKRTFFNHIWREATVEESNLTQTVFLLRRTLGTLPDGGAFIETVPRIGYRLSYRALHNKAGTTASRRKHLGLATYEEQFRLLVSSIEDSALYLLDCAGRVLSWNAGARNIHGYDEDEVLGKHHAMFFVPEDVDAHLPDRDLSLAGRSGPYVTDGWRSRKNGERFWARSSVTPVRLSSGRLVGFASLVQDASERKRHEDTLFRREAILRRERDRLHASAESSMDASFVCEAVRDRNGDIEDFVFTHVNSNFETMSLLSRVDLLGNRMGELFPGSHMEELAAAYRLVVQGGEPFKAELLLDEKIFGASRMRVQAVRFEDGVAVTLRDMSSEQSADSDDSAVPKALGTAVRGIGVGSGKPFAKNRLGAPKSRESWNFHEPGDTRGGAKETTTSLEQTDDLEIPVTRILSTLN